MSESIARDLETLEGVACRMPSSNAFVGVLVALADSNIQNQLGMPFDGNEGVAVSEVLVPFPARLGVDPRCPEAEVCREAAAAEEEHPTQPSPGAFRKYISELFDSAIAISDKGSSGRVLHLPNLREIGVMQEGRRRVKRGGCSYREACRRARLRDTPRTDGSFKARLAETNH